MTPLDVPPSNRRIHYRKLLVLGSGVGLFVIVAILLVQALGGRDNRYPGGLRISVGSDVRLYVGDELIGTGSVFLPWSRILSDLDENSQRLGPVSRPLPVLRVPEQTPDPIGAETIEDLVLSQIGEPGSLSLSVRQAAGGSGGMVGNSTLSVEGWDVLLRRRDGSPDSVLIFCGTVTDPLDGTRTRFLVPIRARGPSRESTIYKIKNSGIQVSGLNVFAMGRSRAVVEWNLAPSPPPDEYLSIFEAKPLYEPSSRR